MIKGGPNIQGLENLETMAGASTPPWWYSVGFYTCPLVFGYSLCCPSNM